MRRRSSYVLAGIVALGMLTACSAKNSTAETKVSTATETVVETEASTAAETVAETETQKQTEAETEAKAELSGESLQIYCGAGMQKPFQEIAELFQQTTECEMNVTYANAAQIQTQIKESQEGDFFVAGSADELKPVADYVANSKELVKHIPVLAVAAGNPKEITAITDLANSEIVTVIGDPESTPIGKIAKKAFADFNITEQVNLAATTTTAPQLATVISLGEADAAIIWKENCNVEGVEICEIAEMEQYIKTIPAARLTFSADHEAGDSFLEFLCSDEVTAIWEKYGYELVE